MISLLLRPLLASKEPQAFVKPVHQDKFILGVLTDFLLNSYILILLILDLANGVL